MDRQAAIEYLRKHIDKYKGKTTSISFVDNVIPKSYIKNVLPNISIPDNFQLFYEVRTNLNTEDLQVLKKSRVLKVQAGIESLANSTLKIMNKGTTQVKNIAFIKIRPLPFLSEQGFA